MTPADARPRLLVVNQYYASREATGQVLRELCEDLAATFDVTVVAGASGEPEADHPGVAVRRVRSSRYGRSSLILRAVNYASFLGGAARRLLRQPRPIAVLAMTDPPVIGLLALLAGWRFRVPAVCVMQDLHPQVGVVTGRLTNPVVVRVLAALQRVIVRRSARVVAIGERMRERLVEIGAPPGRVVTIRNWFDVDDVRPAPRANAWARRHGLDGAFVAMHAGNIGLLQSLETIVEAAVRLPEATFVVVGEGSGPPALDAAIARLAPANLTVLERQPRAELGDVLASADVQLVSLTPGLGGIVEPSKVYGAMAAGRPVIAAVDADSEPAATVREADAGLVVAPADAAALAGAVAALMAVPEAERSAMGERGRRHVEAHHARAAASAAYRDLLLSLARTGAS